MKATRLGQKIGYARVSTDEQNLDLQIQALKSAGCDVIYTDSGISGSVRKRPGLTKTLKSLRKGDKLVVWRLDRLGRSLVNLVQLLEELGKREIRFCSMCEHIDTSSSGGRLVFHMMAALAEFERSLISERTRAGMAAARARGQHVGRFPSMNTEQCLEAQALLDQGIPPTCVAKRFEVTPRTLIRLVQRVTKTSDAAPSSCADPANGDIENVAPRRAEDDTAVTPDPPPTETSTRRRKKPAPIEQDVVSTCASGTAPQRQLEAPIHEHYRTGSTHIWHPHIHPETLPCSSWPEDLNWEPDPLQPLAHTQHRVSRPIASAPDTSSCRPQTPPPPHDKGCVLIAADFHAERALPLDGQVRIQLHRNNKTQAFNVVMDASFGQVLWPLPNHFQRPRYLATDEMSMHTANQSRRQELFAKSRKVLKKHFLIWQNLRTPIGAVFDGANDLRRCRVRREAQVDPQRTLPDRDRSGGALKGFDCPDRTSLRHVIWQIASRRGTYKKR